MLLLNSSFVPVWYILLILLFDFCLLYYRLLLHSVIGILKLTNIAYEYFFCFVWSCLRSKPLKTDGGHDSSFLSGETWEEYLTRMERSREWGDHIVLQALVDVYCLQVIVFNVFQEDIRRTEVQVESDAQNERRLTVFLGHLGEFHYLSLRPNNWFKQWPYSEELFLILTKHPQL